jgi:hypothetical protein
VYIYIGGTEQEVGEFSSSHRRKRKKRRKSFQWESKPFVFSMYLQTQHRVALWIPVNYPLVKRVCYQRCRTAAYGRYRTLYSWLLFIIANESHIFVPDPSSVRHKELCLNGGWDLIRKLPYGTDAEDEIWGFHGLEGGSVAVTACCPLGTCSLTPAFRKYSQLCRWKQNVPPRRWMLYRCL